MAAIKPVIPFRAGSGCLPAVTTAVCPTRPAALRELFEAVPFVAPLSRATQPRLRARRAQGTPEASASTGRTVATVFTTERHTGKHSPRATRQPIRTVPFRPATGSIARC